MFLVFVIFDPLNASLMRESIHLCIYILNLTDTKPLNGIVISYLIFEGNPDIYFLCTVY